MGVLVVYLGGYVVVRSVSFQWREQDGKTGYVVHLHRFGGPGARVASIFEPVFEFERWARGIEVVVYRRQYCRGYPLVQGEVYRAPESELIWESVSIYSWVGDSE